MKIQFDPRGRRVRCIGHIINLSLQAFLHASSKEALKAAMEATATASGSQVVEQFTIALDEAREQGLSQKRKNGMAMDLDSGWTGIAPLQKLHKLAVWLRSSSLHQDAWRDHVGLQLGIDNATRWSSWHQVLGNAIKRKAQISQFLIEFDQELVDYQLDGVEWDLLQKTHSFLGVMAAATKAAEGRRSSISQSLELMDIMLLHFEQQKVSTFFCTPLLLL